MSVDPSLYIPSICGTCKRTMRYSNYYTYWYCDLQCKYVDEQDTCLEYVKA